MASKSVLAFTLVVGVFGAAQSVKNASSLGGPSFRYVPHPRDFIQLDFNTQMPYTVPSGKQLVVTAIGDNDAPLDINKRLVRFVGQTQERLLASDMAGPSFGNGVSMKEVPPGVVFAGGSQLSVDDGGDLWGYLIDDVAPADIQIPYIPHPDDYVIHSGVSYQVPDGKILVITALGSSAGGSASNSRFVEMRVDGITVCRASLLEADGNGLSVQKLPTGFSIEGGKLITFTTASSTMFGYLVEP